MAACGMPASWDACASQRCMHTAPWTDCSAANPDACAAPNKQTSCPTPAAPSLASIAPAAADRRTGSRVTIYGTGFARHVTVLVHDVLVSAFPEDADTDCAIAAGGSGGGSGTTCQWECGKYNFSWVSPRELRVSLPASAKASIVVKVTNDVLANAKAEAVFTSDGPCERPFRIGMVFVFAVSLRILMR